MGTEGLASIPNAHYQTYHYSATYDLACRGSVATMRAIGLIDLGMSNLGSVTRMIKKGGGKSEIVSKADQIKNYHKLILPGVGHFDQGVANMKERSLDIAIKKHVLQNACPILGICLGMQLLCIRSEEGAEDGLALFDAEVVRFSFPEEQRLKIPHMGWNDLKVLRKNPILDEGCEQRFYFVHSYFVRPRDPVNQIASANYGGDFCAAIQKDHIFGAQFHPEKSHQFGLQLMRKFIEL